MKVLKKIESFDWLAFFVAFCMFIRMKPYFLWSQSYLFAWIPTIISSVILFSKSNLNNRKIIPLFIFWAFLFFSFMLLSDFKVARGMLTPILLLVFIPFIKREFSIDIYKYFAFIMGIVLAISLLVWILFITGNVTSSGIISPLNAVKNYDYQVFPLLLVPVGHADFTRFCGPFDEPGVIGTTCLMLLYIARYNLRKWYNVVFLIAGSCAFSLAFFVGLIIFLFLLLFQPKGKKYLLFAAVFFGVFYSLTYDNDYIKPLVYDRLAWDSKTGKLEGENRSSSALDAYFDQQRGSLEYFIGNSTRQCPSSFAGTWGYKNAIIAYGLLFIVGYVLFFFLLTIHNRLTFKSLVLTMALLLMVIYQRPNLLEMLQVFMYSHLIVANSTRKEIQHG